MRVRLLLILLVAFSGLGADCGGGSSHGSAPGSSSSSATIALAGTEGPFELAPAVPEPSAMLVFGVGLLIAGATIRRQR
jgi:hypothetical protein